MDDELRALERAVRRAGVRFVAIMEEPTRVTVQRRADRATLVLKCGPQRQNIMRRHVWAVPVYTLEDMAELAASEDSLIASSFNGVYDLSRQRWLAFSYASMDNAALLEDGWGDTTFERPGTLRALHRPV